MFGKLSIPDLLDSYLDIPSQAEKQIYQWVRLDNADEIDTSRFIYVSQKHLDSIHQKVRVESQYHFNIIYLWMRKFYDPSSVAEEDFSQPFVFKFKPLAQATKLSLILCQELITRNEVLQIYFGNFQYLWYRFELSKLTTDITKNLVNPEEYPAGKEQSRKEYVRRINVYESLIQGEEFWYETCEDKVQFLKQETLGNTTYHALIYPGFLINDAAAQAARECKHFDKHYFQPFLKIHRTAANLARKPGFHGTFINSEGELVTTEKSRQISRTRNRSPKMPKKGFG